VIVVDSNVVAYLLLPGERTEAAERLRRSDPAWAAPSLWQYELANVLWKHCTFAGLDTTLAANLLHAANRLQIRRVDPALTEALELAVASKLSAYDCAYVAVARQLDLPLVTTDNAILKAFPDVAIRLAG